MKYKKRMRRIWCFVLLLGILFGIAQTTTTYAKTLQAPKLSSWRKMPPYPEGDGVTYRVEWKPVKGATAYEVKHYERGYKEFDEWDTYTETVMACKADVSFSEMYKFKVKVRAVKEVNGKKTYSKWVTSKTKVIN